MNFSLGSILKKILNDSFRDKNTSENKWRQLRMAKGNDLILPMFLKKELLFPFIATKGDNSLGPVYLFLAVILSLFFS